MRRWQKFGSDGKMIFYTWQDGLSKLYVTFPYKGSTLQMLNCILGGQGKQELTTFFATLKWVGDAYVQPAADCTASHIIGNYDYLVSPTPLSNLFFNGFETMQGNTGPIFQLSSVPPAFDPNG